MKNLISLVKTCGLIMVLLLILQSCGSVRVVSDYDTSVDFSKYHSFAFLKTGIDRAKINDIDKRRIIKNIKSQMLAKGFVVSENPDLLVSIYTKSVENIDVDENYLGYGFGWGGWSPWYWGAGGAFTVSRSTKGVLYIDLIDAEKKELVWQGVGSGYLSSDVERKEELIKEFVTAIMEKYPPNPNNK
jgi:hypothetical protein